MGGMMDTKMFYSIGEFSKLTGIPAGTLRDFCNAGVITCYRPTGGKRLIPAEAVEELKVNRAKSQKPPKPKIAHKTAEFKLVPSFMKQSI
jgi:excisionase family DNA binding protein